MSKSPLHRPPRRPHVWTVCLLLSQMAVAAIAWRGGWAAGLTAFLLSHVPFWWATMKADSALFSPVLSRLPTTEPLVWLTIDDGPSDDTSAILDLLDRHGARATFFIVGQRAQQRPELVRELLRRGHGLGFVPLVGTRFLVIDMVRWLRLPLLVVARAGLGTINHTALTVIGAHQAGLPVAGVVLNRYPDKPSLAEATNPQVIAAITEVPILGLVPEIPDLEDPSGKEQFLAAMDRVCHGLAQACAARAFLECMILK